MLAHTRSRCSTCAIRFFSFHACVVHACACMVVAYTCIQSDRTCVVSTCRRELSSPFNASTNLNEHEPTRHIYEVELDILMPAHAARAMMPYAPGDCIAIRSPNRPSLVLALVDLLIPDEGAGVGVHQQIQADVLRAQPDGDTEAGLFPPTYSEEVRQSLRRRLSAAQLRDLIWTCDLSSPTRLSLRSLAGYCAASQSPRGPQDASLLVRLASSLEDFAKYIQRPGINVVELLEAVTSCRPSLPALLESLAPLAPRYYSISSSPLQYTPASAGGSAAATFSLRFAFTLVNRTLSRTEEEKAKTVYRLGHCTGFLVDLCRMTIGEESVSNVWCSKRASHLQVRMKPSTGFRLPEDPRTPMVTPHTTPTPYTLHPTPYTLHPTP
jgi:sulfite reductase alpha subunit-like flavoprotein